MKYRPDAPPFWEVRDGGGPITELMQQRARPPQSRREKDVSDREPAKYLMAPGCRQVGLPSQYKSLYQ